MINLSSSWSKFEFPENFYPCFSQDYLKKVNLGKIRMKNSSVYIVGLCRDVGKYFDFMKTRVEKIGSMFKSYNIYIYENDSIDDTPSKLSKWKKENSKLEFDSEILDKVKWPAVRDFGRTYDMAYYRNKYVKYLKKNCNSNYVIVLDLDLQGGWSYDGLANTFGWDNWDFMGSNGMHIENMSWGGWYYDTWAHREIDNKITNCGYSRGQNIIKLDSCFGGMGVYRTEAFLCGAVYESYDCDHPTFHKNMRRLGYKNIYLNPSQITLYTFMLNTLKHL